MESFEEIWEKDRPWPQGRSILNMIASASKGRFFHLEVDLTSPSRMKLVLPFPYAGEAPHPIPPHLMPVFNKRIQLVLDYYFLPTKAILERHEGKHLDPLLIRVINMQLVGIETIAKVQCKPLLYQIIADRFGLIPVKA